MSEDVHDEALRRYEEAAAALRTGYTSQRPNTELRRALWGPYRRPSPPTIPGSCYEASFGWVHVRPGCRCPH